MASGTIKNIETTVGNIEQIGYSAVITGDSIITLPSGKTLDDYKFLFARVYFGDTNTWLTSDIIPMSYFKNDTFHWTASHFYVGGTVFSWMYQPRSSTQINCKNAGGHGSLYLYGMN